MTEVCLSDLEQPNLTSLQLLTKLRDYDMLVLAPIDCESC